MPTYLAIVAQAPPGEDRDLDLTRGETEGVGVGDGPGLFVGRHYG